MSRIIKDNDYAVLHEGGKNVKLVQLRNGDKTQTTNGGFFRHMNIIGKEWGSHIIADNKPEVTLHALQPKSTLITDTLARKTQILFAMDNAAIIFKLGILPGCTVVQAGTGSGSLSCAISEALGETGRLFTFEFNKERAQATKEFFQGLGKNNITANWRDVVSEGFQLPGAFTKTDCLFLDVPNPWDAISHAKSVLRPMGRICCFSPCIEQVQKTAQELRKQGFAKVETVETLMRQIEVNGHEAKLQGPSGMKRYAVWSKAAQNSYGHTGFLTFAVRR